MRIVLAPVALLFLATFAPLGLFSVPVPPPDAKLWAAPVPLDEEQPGRRRLGALIYLEGWRLRSDDRRFGGISAMHIEDGQVTAVSDSGVVFRFALPAGARAQPLQVDPLASGPGSSRSKRDRDSEAMLVRGDRIWVAFERSNSVGRYDRATRRREAASAPPAMKRWPANGGAEGMVRLPDGRFLIFAEGSRRRDGTTEVLVFAGDPAVADTPAVSLGYRAPSGYRITDAALLPDGRVAFLNRRFSILGGISAKLTVAELPPLEEGTIISGTEIAHFEPPTTVDNMEALSVTREDGRTILWIASDNNYNPLQRTLLLKFALAK